MKWSRRRTGIIVIVALVIIAAAGALVFFKPASKTTATDAIVATTATPTTAFSIRDGVLPANWSISSGSTEFLNLAGKNGCFTTSALTVLDDYENITDIDRFKQSFAVKFEQAGYTIDLIQSAPLTIDVSGTKQTINAISYALTLNGATTYHIDGGVKGKASTAFMSLSCTSAADLDSAQTALLSITYNDTYKPLSSASKTQQ